jgi:hypothetical protein
MLFTLAAFPNIIAAQDAATELPASGSEAPTPESAPADDLSIAQGQLADRWDRLEQVAARLAELSASTDPHRADLLRKAIAQAREKEVHLRFEAIVDLLEQERYSIATQNQQTLEVELEQLLELLLKENRAEELRSQQAWLRMQLKEVNRIIRLQRGVKARTEGGDDTDRLAEDQEKIGERTSGLADQIQAAQGGSPDGEGGQSRKGGSQSKGGEGNESDGEAQDSQRPEQGEDGAQGEGESSEKPGEGEAENSQPDSGAKEQQSPGESGTPSESDSSPSQNSAPGGEQGQQGGQQGQEGQQNPSPGGQPGEGQGSPGEGSEGESGPPPSSTPDENLQRRLRAAQERMDQARQKLEEAERDGAAEEQERALRELEEAKAELERILRQLREEEMERTLTLLEARFRKMLEAQIEILEGTVRLDRVSAEARDHDDEIEAGRLSRQEEALVREADKALEILLDEGTSVAFPEAVMQMRADMQDVAKRLAQLDAGGVTQGIEEDIIAQLEESIEALQQALEELEKNKTPPGQAPPPGEPQDPALVDMLEEVKMIRALQMRINRRTQRYSEMIGEVGTEDAELLSALKQLAERQERVYKATHDLHLGKNQ